MDICISVCIFSEEFRLKFLDLREIITIEDKNRSEIRNYLYAGSTYTPENTVAYILNTAAARNDDADYEVYYNHDVRVFLYAYIHIYLLILKS